MQSMRSPILPAVFFILDSACADNYKIFVLRWNTKKLTKSDSHAESVLLCHTYISLKQKNVGLWS